VCSSDLPRLYDGYVGRYQLAPQIFLTITRDGDRLYGQASGQGKFEIFPEGDKEFFAKVTDLQISFKTDDHGRATELTIHQMGMHTPAKRTEDAKPRKEIAVDAKILEGYTGRYQVSPAMILEVTRDGNRLFTQATGQAKFEVFAESERDFFVKAFDAQLTFNTDAQGKATAMVLHQGGRDTTAKRIE
jgi:hypothetical protein